MTVLSLFWRQGLNIRSLVPGYSKEIKSWLLDLIVIFLNTVQSNTEKTLNKLGVDFINYKPNFTNVKDDERKFN